MVKLEMKPEVPPGRGEFEGPLRQLENRPGEWFRLYTMDDEDEAQRMALAMRAWSQRRDSAWRISKRALRDGLVGIWACYQGNGDSRRSGPSSTTS